MAGSVITPPGEPKVGIIRATVGYYHSVMLEMRKVTWPDFPQVRSATVAIIIFVLAIGVMISTMDLVLGLVLNDLLPRLTGR